jgi:hypothetical protein
MPPARDLYAQWHVQVALGMRQRRLNSISLRVEIQQCGMLGLPSSAPMVDHHSLGHGTRQVASMQRPCFAQASRLSVRSGIRLQRRATSSQCSVSTVSDTRCSVCAAHGLRVAAIARGADKADLAKKLGAHHYIDSDAGGIGEALQALGSAAFVLATVSAGKSVAR